MCLIFLCSIEVSWPTYAKENKIEIKRYSESRNDRYNDSDNDSDVSDLSEDSVVIDMDPVEKDLLSQQDYYLHLRNHNHDHDCDHNVHQVTSEKTSDEPHKSFEVLIDIPLDDVAKAEKNNFSDKLLQALSFIRSDDPQKKLWAAYYAAAQTSTTMTGSTFTFVTNFARYIDEPQFIPVFRKIGATNSFIANLIVYPEMIKGAVPVYCFPQSTMPDKIATTINILGHTSIVVGYGLTTFASAPQLLAAAGCLVTVGQIIKLGALGRNIYLRGFEGALGKDLLKNPRPLEECIICQAGFKNLGSTIGNGMIATANIIGHHVPMAFKGASLVILASDMGNLPDFLRAATEIKKGHSCSPQESDFHIQSQPTSQEQQREEEKDDFIDLELGFGLSTGH